MNWSSKRLHKKKKSYLELLPLEYYLFWLPGVVLQAYQISLFYTILNIPKDVLLDSGNSLTFKFSVLWKPFRITFFFFLWIFVLNAITASWCNVSFWNRTVHIPWAQKGRASQWHYNRSSKGKIFNIYTLPESHQVSSIPMARAKHGWTDCKHIPVDT